jgi:hypothetical protein
MCTRDDGIKLISGKMGRDEIDRIELAQVPMELYCEQQA